MQHHYVKSDTTFASILSIFLLWHLKSTIRIDILSILFSNPLDIRVKLYCYQKDSFLFHGG